MYRVKDRCKKKGYSSVKEVLQKIIKRYKRKCQKEADKNGRAKKMFRVKRKH